MRSKVFTLLISILLLGTNLYAQDVTTVEATSSDISENLDLEAVASLFGDSKDLEDFETRLNDPETQISNLDLNGDNEVDYLRVLETSESSTHVITIQAVLGQDIFQDVATIDVEKDNSGNTTVQVVGDVYMYGENYIVEPVYVHTPIIVTWFWGVYYTPWRSPWYWGYYPPVFRPCHPVSVSVYHRNVHVHVNVRHTYHHTTVRHSSRSVHIQKSHHRNDYGKKHPSKSFSNRHKGKVNSRDVNYSHRVSNKQSAKSKVGKGVPSTGRKVNSNWKTQSQRSGSSSNVKNNRVQVRQNSTIGKSTRTTNSSSRSTTIRNNSSKTSNNNRSSSTRTSTKTSNSRSGSTPMRNVKSSSQSRSSKVSTPSKIKTTSRPTTTSPMRHSSSSSSKSTRTTTNTSTRTVKSSASKRISK